MSGSLQRRIRRGQLFTLLLIFPLLWLVSDSALRQLSEDFILSRIEHDSESLLAALTRSAEGAWTVDSERLPAFYQRPQSGHYFIVLAAAESLRSRSLWDYTVDIVPLAPGEIARTSMRVNDEHWLTRAVGVKKQGRDLTLWLAEDISPLERQLRRFELYLALLLTLALGLLLTLQHFLLRRGFRPLAGLRDKIRNLRVTGAGSLDDALPSEMAPLAQEINRVLQQLDQRIRRSRHALGNLAHELKRPLQQLAVMQTELPTKEAERLNHIRLHMQRLLERELKRARIAGSPSPGRLFEPAADLMALVQVFERLYPQCAIQVDLDGRTPWPLDRDDCLELLGNLIDNACKYARQRCRVSLSQEGTQCRIAIEDDGMGVSPERMGDLTARGVRLDESRDGDGLGLSICRDIIDSYQGSLTLSASSLGGLKVLVEMASSAT